MGRQKTKHANKVTRVPKKPAPVENPLTPVTPPENPQPKQTFGTPGIELAFLHKEMLKWYNMGHLSPYNMTTYFRLVIAHAFDDHQAFKRWVTLDALYYEKDPEKVKKWAWRKGMDPEKPSALGIFGFSSLPNVWTSLKYKPDKLAVRPYLIMGYYILPKILENYEVVFKEKMKEETGPKEFKKYCDQFMMEHVDFHVPRVVSKGLFDEMKRYLEQGNLSMDYLACGTCVARDVILNDSDAAKQYDLLTMGISERLLAEPRPSRGKHKITTLYNECYKFCCENDSTSAEDSMYDHFILALNADFDRMNMLIHAINDEQTLQYNLLRNIEQIDERKRIEEGTLKKEDVRAKNICHCTTKCALKA